MNDFVFLADHALGVALVALTTLATMLSIGVAFLMSPSRATLWWLLSFTLVMVSSYGMVVGALKGYEPVRWISLGLMMGGPALLWSGFRALRGARPLSWIGPIVSVLSAAALFFVGDSAWHTPVSRVVFFAASVFGGLFLLEWRRLPQRRDPFLWPLAVLSLVFLVVGAVGVVGAYGVVSGWWRPITDGIDPALIQLAASLGILVYVTCAVVAVVGVTTRARLGAARSETDSEPAWQRFQTIAAEQLSRAQRSAQEWSVVCLELDDVAEIRRTAGATALARLTERFRGTIRSVFPAESEVGMPQPNRAVVVVPRPDAETRELLRTALLEISRLDVDGRIPVQPSASAGWAPTSTSGYDLGSLIYFSREAAALARENGGDRWERVGPAVVERLLSGPGRP